MRTRSGLSSSRPSLTVIECSSSSQPSHQHPQLSDNSNMAAFLEEAQAELKSGSFHTDSVMGEAGRCELFNNIISDSAIAHLQTDEETGNGDDGDDIEVPDKGEDNKEQDSDEDNEESDDDEDHLHMMLISWVTALVYDKKRCRTNPLNAHQYVTELLQGNSGRVHEVFRMELPTFMKLRDVLVSNGWLQTSRGVTPELQLAIFMAIVGGGMSNRKVQERFQLSGDTVSRHFSRVLEALMLAAPHWMATQQEIVQPRIADDPNYYPFFRDCIGALDGTHFPLKPPHNRQAAYRNRKGWYSQNVLLVVNLDGRFILACPGWEGSVHDSRVLTDCFQKGWRIKPGKYMLGDRGYPLNPQVLTPYRGVRYDLREQAAASLRPANAKELFNLRHSALRNVVERSIGALKKRFPILQHDCEYSIDTCLKLAGALPALQNFILNEQQDNIRPALEEPLSLDAQFTCGGMVERRDAIAEAMWAQYRNVTSSS